MLLHYERKWTFKMDISRVERNNFTSNAKNMQFQTINSNSIKTLYPSISWLYHSNAHSNVHNVKRAFIYDCQNDFKMSLPTTWDSIMTLKYHFDYFFFRCKIKLFSNFFLQSHFLTINFSLLSFHIIWFGIQYCYLCQNLWNEMEDILNENH